MTYVLPTKNLGEVCVKYSCVMRDELLIEDDSILVSDFCSMLEKLADGVDKFLIDSEWGETFECSWDSENRMMEFGKYFVEGSLFGVFANYVLNRGMLGWVDYNSAWEPKCARAGAECLRERLNHAPVSEEDPSKMYELVEQVVGVYQHRRC